MKRLQDTSHVLHHAFIYDNYIYVQHGTWAHYFQPPLNASRVLLQPSIQASLSNAPCKTELKVFFWLAGHACKSAQTSFFSRNFSPFTRTRGMYCRTSFLHCQHENKISPCHCISCHRKSTEQENDSQYKLCMLISVFFKNSVSANHSDFLCDRKVNLSYSELRGEKFTHIKSQIAYLLNMTFDLIALLDKNLNYLKLQTSIKWKMSDTEWQLMVGNK